MRAAHVADLLPVDVGGGLVEHGRDEESPCALGGVRGQGDFPPHVQRSNPFRPISLVRGEAHQVDFELLQIDYHLAYLERCFRILRGHTVRQRQEDHFCIARRDIDRISFGKEERGDF